MVKKNVLPKPTPKKKASISAPEPENRRIYFKQSDFPQCTLQQSQKIASGIVDNFASDSASPPDVALAIGVSPTSSGWQVLTGASIAYGLTEGGVNATRIKLTQLGRRLVAPEEEGEDLIARREAVLMPRIMREFFEKYRRAKFPSDAIAGNVLKSLGLPAEKVGSAIEALKANGTYAGIIRDTPTGPFVNMDSPTIPVPIATQPRDDIYVASSKNEALDLFNEVESEGSPTISQNSDSIAGTSKDTKKNRVFITHGKQRDIVAQIKELLLFGKFEPVVSVERESTAIPVPEKVFEDMRSCGAGVLHVGAEGTYRDTEGSEHVKLNDNVLIEIGAAIALYGKRVILLVEKGVVLPSNLQGLYRCEFEGSKLDYDSTMKLLKTFSQFG
jgi:predicted nucleotide-binding protein